MKIHRRFTEAGLSPYDGVDFTFVTSEIKGVNHNDIQVPSFWSQSTCDKVISQFCEVPDENVRVKEDIGRFEYIKHEKVVKKRRSSSLVTKAKS